MPNASNSPLTTGRKNGKTSDERLQELTILCRLTSRCVDVPVVALLLFSSLREGGFQPPCSILAQDGMEEGRLFNPEAPLFYQNLLEDKMIIWEDLTKVTEIGPLFFQPGNAAYRFLWTLPIGDQDLPAEGERYPGISPDQKILLCLLDDRPRIPNELQLEEVNMLGRLIGRYCSRGNDSSETASRLKKLTHDLRTPLTSVTMLSQLMKAEEGLPEEIIFMCDQLFAAAKKMDDLLSASEEPS